MPSSSTWRNQAGERCALMDSILSPWIPGSLKRCPFLETLAPDQYLRGRGGSRDATTSITSNFVSLLSFQEGRHPVLQAMRRGQPVAVAGRGTDDATDGPVADARWRLSCIHSRAGYPGRRRWRPWPCHALGPGGRFAAARSAGGPEDGPGGRPPRRPSGTGPPASGFVLSARRPAPGGPGGHARRYARRPTWRQWRGL
jgi:hypothetical protein